jgi:hypothetical protein
VSTPALGRGLLVSDELTVDKFGEDSQTQRRKERKGIKIKNSKNTLRPFLHLRASALDVLVPATPA